MAPPKFYVLAGPNGSGKTTFALNNPAFRDISFINADIEAQQLNPGSPAKAALAAGRVTLSKISQEISERRTFILETTLSGLGPLETIRRALAAGYVIDFTYLCLDAPSTNISRVAKRVLAGGHHVPDRDIERRYHRSLQNLPVALVEAERAQIFDNSAPSEPTLLLEMREQELLFLRRELPDWFRSAFQIGNSIEDSRRHVERFLQDVRKRKR
jgi:predicted ABC-type ATPase